MQKKANLFFLLASTIISLLFLQACNDNYTPKPRGYPRVTFPEKRDYQQYSSSSCNFAFEYPVYGKIIKADSLNINKKADNPCWMDISFDIFNAKLHLSYKAIDKQNDLGRLIEDAHKLSSKHIIKANYIDDSLFETKNNVHGLYYKIGGNTATSTEWFLTDTTKNFMWASLYFNNVPNEDSIAPLVQYLRVDIEHLINTFTWKQTATK